MHLDLNAFQYRPHRSVLQEAQAQILRSKEKSTVHLTGVWRHRCERKK